RNGLPGLRPGGGPAGGCPAYQDPVGRGERARPTEADFRGPGRESGVGGQTLDRTSMFTPVTHCAVMVPVSLPAPPSAMALVIVVGLKPAGVSAALALLITMKFSLSLPPLASIKPVTSPPTLFVSALTVTLIDRSFLCLSPFRVMLTLPSTSP